MWAPIYTFRLHIIPYCASAAVTSNYRCIQAETVSLVNSLMSSRSNNVAPAKSEAACRSIKLYKSAQC